MLKTSTIAKFPEINLADMLKVMHDFEDKYPFRYTRLKCSPEAYIALKDYFVEQEHEEMLREAIAEKNHKKKTRGEEIKNYWGSLYGIDIVLDPDQLPGEMEFE